MAKTLWVVQENLGRSRDYERLLAAFQTLDLPFRPVAIVPFSDEVPEVERDGPIVAYGSTRFITNVSRAREWYPGAFFDPNAFSMDRYIRHYGRDVLNHAARITTIQDFQTLGCDEDRSVFVRPLRDLKEFEAGVHDVVPLQAWFSKIAEGGYLLDPTTPILVADPVRIDQEWRVFIVAGGYCGGSLYRTAGELTVDPEVPSEVIAFSNRMAGAWSPAPAYVLDIASVGGALKVIEINCFNSSGFYASDVEAIVRAVTSLATDLGLEETTP